MKKIIMGSLISLISYLDPLSSFAAEKFNIDNQHSYVLWKIDHLGFSKQVGKWYVNGFVILDKEHPDLSKVQATITISELVTGIPELDKHLKGKEFFDADRFPKATFESTIVDVINDNSAKVTGNLSLRGVTKPITLRVTLNKVGKHPINHQMGAGFTATTTLKRSDFGMNAYLPILGDEVVIEIGTEAYQDNEQGTHVKAKGERGRS